MKKDFSHIKRIDIEIQSFCNRKCAWCPNNTIDRSFYKILPDFMFTKLLKELKEYDFNKNNDAELTFLGFQEIFFNPILLKKRINEVRQYFKTININLNTNGDFLTKNSLMNLNVNVINVMDYDCKGVQYWTNKLLNLSCTNLIVQNNDIKAKFNNIWIRVTCNWPKHAGLENRGGYFSKDNLTNLKWKNDMCLRVVPCPEPVYNINISYNGSVTPCCHIRFDDVKHEQYILGNLSNSSLYDIIFGEKMINFQKQITSLNYENYPMPCKNCQKIRSSYFTDAPNHFIWDGKKYFKIQKEYYEKSKINRN